MISKKDILQMARHIIKRGKGIPDRRLMHPYREWFIGLFGMMCVIGAGATYNAITFRYYNALEDHVVGNQPSAVEYRHDVAERVLTTYEERSAEYTRLQAQIEPLQIVTQDDTVEDVPEIGDDPADPVSVTE